MQTQMHIMPLCGLAEIILENIDFLSAEEETKMHTSLLRIIENNQINWFEFYRLAHEERKLMVEGFVNVAIMASVHNSDGTTYQVSFQNHISKQRYPCLTSSRKGNRIEIIFTDFDDASAFSESWEVWMSHKTVIDEFICGIFVREVKRKESAYRGKKWL